MINKILQTSLKERLQQEQEALLKPDIFRASSTGSCTRKLAYKFHKFKTDLLIAYDEAIQNKQEQEFLEKNAILGRSSLVFELGHTIEAQLANKLGTSLKDQQKEAICKLGNITISGHIDGTITDNQGKNWIVDIKSTNTRHFKYEVEKGLIDDKYKYQAHCYMYALGIHQFQFLYYNKDTSHLATCFLYFDFDIMQKIKNKYEKIISSTPEKLPAKDYDVENKQTGWNCSYCSYFHTCYGDKKIEVIDGKPKAINKN